MRNQAPVGDPGFHPTTRDAQWGSRLNPISGMPFRPTTRGAQRGPRLTGTPTS
jgi:hypothetical protein